MAFAVDPRQNQLLAAMPAAVWQRLLPHLELVDLPLGAVLHTSGEIMPHVFFPVTSVVSKHFIMKDGAATEFALIGREGMIGVAHFLGGLSLPSRAVVQSAGSAFRLKSSVLAQELGDTAPLARMLLLYTQALLAQVAQTAACNRHHSIHQQLCRCLLSTMDRLQSNEIAMTQELIANMLGVRRQGVVMAARKLREDGVISYRQGRITVHDRNKLEQQSCECYSVVKSEYERLLPPTPVD